MIIHSMDLNWAQNVSIGVSLRLTLPWQSVFVCHPKILHRHCLQFLLGVKMARRETENNAYAKFWGDKQRALWYVMVFSGVVNSSTAL